MNKTLLFVSIMLIMNTLAVAQQLAFPGAEGAGMYTTGGRGGNVYFVNSLADTETGNATTHEGTLRWCLKQTGPRIVMFKVAGIIEITKDLKILANTTILGQTAPGDGICIKNKAILVTQACVTTKTTIDCPYISLGGDNIIIRYIRIRPGDDIDNSVNAPIANIKFETDAIYGRNYSNIIIDHCSFSWGIDEVASFYDNTNFTLQWSIISESLRDSYHPKDVHGYGGIWGGKSASFHHNLIAHHDSRNPRMCGTRYSNLPAVELVDFRNNVIYNWGSNSGYAGEGGSYNFVNNYYKSSLATSVKDRIFQPNADDGTNSQPAGVWGTFYVNGNYVNGYATTTATNWNGIDPNTANGALPGGTIDGIKSTTEFAVSAIETQTAENAYISVLASAGASKARDAVDSRVMNEVKNALAPTRGSGTTVAPKPGLIDSPSDVGGYPTYTFNTNEISTDSDYDGMPDEWEISKGLDKNNASDRNTIGASGYTLLEEFIYREELATAIRDISISEKGAFIYPNPVSEHAILKFNMSNSGYAKIELVNIAGQKVLSIANDNFLMGENEVSFSVKSIKSGIYICTIQQQFTTEVIKIVIK